MNRISGLAFHRYHNSLIDWVWDFKKDVERIKKIKYESEQELLLRLKLFKMIPIGTLPINLRRAQKTYKQMGKTFEEVFTSIRVEERYANLVGVRVATNTGDKWIWCSDMLAFESDAIAKLHDELCPNCPWDGVSILGERRMKNE